MTSDDLNMLRQVKRIRGLCTAKQRERDNNIVPWLTDAEDAALTAALTRLATLEAEQVAIWGALEELRWPDLPGIPYFVYEPESGGVQKREIPPNDVVGIFAAIRKHVGTMMPWAVRCVQDAQEVESLRTRLATLTVENESLQSDVDFMDTALIMARQYLKAGRPDDALGVLDALEEKP